MRPLYCCNYNYIQVYNFPSLFLCCVWKKYITNCQNHTEFKPNQSTGRRFESQMTLQVTSCCTSEYRKILFWSYATRFTLIHNEQTFFFKWSICQFHWILWRRLNLRYQDNYSVMLHTLLSAILGFIPLFIKSDTICIDPFIAAKWSGVLPCKKYHCISLENVIGRKRRTLYKYRKYM